MKRPARAALAAVLCTPLMLGTPAHAAGSGCDVTAPAPRPGSAAPLPADVLRAGEATGRGLFLTYGDQDTVLEGGTVVPPDLSAPLAQAAVDRTGMGTALASPGYSPYSDAAGLPNAFTGTELPLGELSEPTRAKITGTPPQDQAVSFPPGSPGGGCVRLSAGPLAQAAAIAGTFAPAVSARIGDVKALSGPLGQAAQSVVSVVLTDIDLGQLHIEQVVLSATAVADGRTGSSAASSLVSGITVAGQAMRLTPAGLVPVGAPAPDTAALAAAGIELLSAGSERHASGAASSTAYASGPVVRLTTPDGRVLTLILGEATVSAQYDRTR